MNMRAKGFRCALGAPSDQSRKPFVTGCGDPVRALVEETETRERGVRPIAREFARDPGFRRAVREARCLEFIHALRWGDGGEWR